MNRCFAAVAALALSGCATAPAKPTPTTPSAPGPTPQAKTEAVKAAPKQEPPASGPPRDIHFPPIVRSTAKNGLEINTVALPQLPIVQIQLVVKSGSAADDARLPGQAHLTAQMLKEGTRRKSSAKLAEAIDYLGANLHVDNDEENVFITMSALSEQFEQALSLVAEVVTTPAFKQSELDKLKKREEARLALESQNARYLASRELHRVLYGEHPYAHVDTNLKVLKRITRGDLVRWHRQHFAPNNATLIVVGQVGAEQVGKVAEKVFAKWRKHKVPKVAYAPPPKREGREVIIVDRPQSVQSVFYIGNLALPRKDPDFVPLLVANQVLGGSAASRLFMDLREKRSLTYGAYSNVGERVDVAPFIAYAAVRNEVTGEAMQAFDEHLQQITLTAPPAQELRDAKRFLVDRFPLRIDTPGKIAGLVADLRIHGLPDDYWDGFRDQIEAVSPEQALEAAKKYIDHDRGVIVVVGKAADVKPALESYGPITVVDPDGNVVVAPQTAGNAAGNATDKRAGKATDKTTAKAAPPRDKSAQPPAAPAKQGEAAKPAAAAAATKPRSQGAKNETSSAAAKDAQGAKPHANKE